MEEAAIGGVPQAQYFMGNAYRNGQGVEKNLTLAIRWWTKAVEFGQQRWRNPFHCSAAKRYRLTSLSAVEKTRSRPSKNIATNSGLTTRMQAGTTRANHWASHCSKIVKASNGVTALFAEAYALSETAHDELARLYETGLDTRLVQFDKRILTCFTTTAADGFIPSKQGVGTHLWQRPRCHARFAESQGDAEGDFQAGNERSPGRDCGALAKLGNSHARCLTPVATIS